MLPLALVVVGAYFLATRRESQPARSSLLGALAALGAGITWGVADTAMAKYCLTHGHVPADASCSLLAVSWDCLGFSQLSEADSHGSTTRGTE